MRASSYYYVTIVIIVLQLLQFLKFIMPKFWLKFLTNKQ